MTPAAVDLAPPLLMLGLCMSLHTFWAHENVVFRSSSVLDTVSAGLGPPPLLMLDLSMSKNNIGSTNVRIIANTNLGLRHMAL